MRYRSKMGCIGREVISELDNKATLQTSIKWESIIRDKREQNWLISSMRANSKMRGSNKQVYQIQEGKSHSHHSTCSLIRHSLSEKMSGT